MTRYAKRIEANKYNKLETARFAINHYVADNYSIFTDGTYFYIGGWRGAQELGYTLVK
jgi:hypothetical protein